jgi:hypothetical protein
MPSTTVAFSATPNFPCGTPVNATLFKVTLTANVTSSTFGADCTAGLVLGVELTQDGTGGRTFSAPAGYEGCTIEPSANSVTVIIWDANGKQSSCNSVLFTVSNTQTSSYQILASDTNKIITMNGSSLTATLPAVVPSKSWIAKVCNANASALTVARNGLTINGSAKDITPIQQNQCVPVWSDDTAANYRADIPPIANSPAISAAGTINLGITVPVSVFTSHIASGNVDLYTPAVGRKAIITNVTAYNDSAGTPTAYPALKIGGTYYPVASTTATIAANSVNTFPVNAVLDSTTTLAVNVGTGSVVNIQATILEFDAAVSLFSKYIAGLASGANTIYTVAAGKKACLLGSGATINVVVGMFTPSGIGNTVAYFNSSGGARTVSINFVPNGGSVATTNQFYTVSVADKSSLNKPFSACLNAGDFVNITTDAATATQIAWATFWETP